MQQRTLENGWVLTWAWHDGLKKMHFNLWDRNPSLPNRKNLGQSFDEKKLINEARAIHSHREALHEVREGEADG